MKHMKEDRNGLFGVAFSNPLATVGAMMILVITIAYWMYTTHIWGGVISDTFKEILLLSPGLVVVGVELILGNWMWDFRWMALVGLGALALYGLLIYPHILVGVA
jgi:hypothetical protein